MMMPRHFGIRLFAALWLCALLFLVLDYNPQDARAQTTTGLLPVPKMQFFDNNGLPLNGGKVCSYQAGTSTPLATYTDSTGGTANSDPVILDASGRANIWLGAAAYKIVLMTAGTDNTCNTGTTLWTVDNVTAPTTSTSSVTIPSGQTLTMASGSTFTSNTNLLPGANNTYNLGSNSFTWATGYINSLNLAGSIAEAANNSYDLGSVSYAFRSLYSIANLSNAHKVCGTSVALSVNCYSIAATIDGTGDAYIDFFDDQGTRVLRLSREESSASTNNMQVGGNAILPITTNATDLGSSGQQFRDGWFGGTVIIQQLAIGSGGSIGLPNYSASLLSSYPSGASGSMAWCTDCTIGSNPCTGGSTGALAIYNRDGSVWQCK